MSETFNYDEINAEIIKAIVAGNAKAASILTYVACYVNVWPKGRDKSRVIDGQLQKLKRDGRITFDKGNWSLKG